MLSAEELVQLAGQVAITEALEDPTYTLREHTGVR